jgi:hypothetical protein
MMNPKDAIMQIRALFEDMPMVGAPAPMATPSTEVPVTFAEYSLMDGTKVMISELVIGGLVTLEDGTPAPMGEHQLADGTKIQLDELGAIIEIASPKEEVMPEEVAPVEVELSKKLNQEMEDKMAVLVAENEGLKTKVAELESKVKNGFSQVAELIEALTKTPNAEPIAQPKQNFSSHVTTHAMKLDRLEKFRNALLNK